METLISQVGKRWYVGKQRLSIGERYAIGDDWEIMISHTICPSNKLRHDLAVRNKHGVAFGCAINYETHVLITDMGAISIAQPTATEIALAREVLEALGPQSHTIFVRLSQLEAGETLEDVKFHASTVNAIHENNFSDGTIQTLGKSRGRLMLRCTGGTYLLRVQRHSNTRQIHTLEVILQRKVNRAQLAAALACLA